VVPFANKKKALSKYDEIRMTARDRPSQAANNRISFIKTWLESKASMLGQRVWFYPDDSKPIVVRSGLSYFNSYKSVKIPVVVHDPAITKVLTEHTKFIVPEPHMYEAMLDWLAFKFRYPWEKTYAFMLITPGQQTGKGVLLELVRRLFGREYVKPVPESVFSDKASGFNEFLEGSLFNFCDEAKFTERSYNRMKAWVYEPMQHVDMKNGFKGTCETFGSWLIFSNHLNSAVIGPDDMRLAVSIMRSPRKSTEYYTDIFKQLQDKSMLLVSHFAALLRERDISKFDQRKPPWSEAKASMVKSSKNDLQYAVEALIEDEVGPCMFDIVSSNLITGFLSASVGDLKISRHRVSAMLDKLTSMRHLEGYSVIVKPHESSQEPLFNRVRQSGLCCLRNYYKWKGASNAQLKLEYLRAREAAINNTHTKSKIKEIIFEELKEA